MPATNKDKTNCQWRNKEGWSTAITRRKQRDRHKSNTQKMHHPSHKSPRHRRAIQGEGFDQHTTSPASPGTQARSLPVCFTPVSSPTRLTLFPAGTGREQGSKKQRWDWTLSIPAGTATEQISGKLTVGLPHKGRSSSLPFHRAGSRTYIPDHV